MTVFCSNQWLDSFFGSGRISNTRSNHSDILSIRHGEAWQIVLALTVFLTNQLAESFQPLILDQSAGGINSGSYFGPIRWRNQLRILFWTNQLAESSQPLVLTNQLDESSQPLVLDQSAGWIISASCFGPISWLNYLSLLFWTNQLAESSQPLFWTNQLAELSTESLTHSKKCEVGLRE